MGAQEVGYKQLATRSSNLHGVTHSMLTAALRHAMHWLHLVNFGVLEMHEQLCVCFEAKAAGGTAVLSLILGY